MGFFDKHLDKLDEDIDLDEIDIDDEDMKDEEIDKKDSKPKKSKFFKDFFSKKRKKSDFLTQDDIAQNKKKVVNKFIVWLSIIGFLFISLYALFITFTRTPPKRVVISKKEESSIKLVEEKDNIWKLQVNNELNDLRNKLNDEVEEVKKVVKEENNLTINAINKLLEEKVLGKIRQLESKINNLDKFKEDILNIVKNMNEKTLKEAKTYTLTKSLELQQKLSQLKPVEVSIEASSKGKVNKKNIFNKSNKKEETANNMQNKQKNYQQKLIEVEKEVSNLDVQNIPLDMEVQKQLTTKKVKKEENIPYHLMTGFTKGILITGVSAPTFSAGLINPKPVLISVNGKAIIANDQHENIKDCLLIGKATGNMNTSRAEILITRISCSIPTNTPGVYKKIEATGNPIGWVIGEDGKYGLRGRLVDSAGKVIVRQLTVGFLQGVSQAFAPASILPANLQATTTSPIKNTNAALARGTTTGLSNAFASLAEYYKKMLDGMYPYVDVMAGRRVTILLKGFQDIKITKYRKVDVSNVQSNGEEEYEVQIDYNDF